MKIAIVGAGPAGLFFARLLKCGFPQATVRVFEQNPEGATWGFGVGLGGRTLREIAAADQDIHDRISAAMLFGNTQRIHLDGTERTLNFAETLGAIERLALLDIILHAAREAGVEVMHETRIDSPAELADYDLIVAADGVNSVIRAFYADQFGTKTTYLTNHFAWYGVAKALKPSALVFRSVPAGRLIAHYYAYAPAMSTFVAECDHETWIAGGFEAMTDDERRAVFETKFADMLEGMPLIENRSIWRQFPVVTNDAWYAGKVVLMGDGLRSAHFSIGSGTRLAMEDAIALYGAIKDKDGDLPAALPAYVERRRPARDSFGEAAERSFLWYEDVANRMRQPLDSFIYDFLTRTGRVDEERLRKYAPDFFDIWQRHKAGMPDILGAA